MSQILQFIITFVGVLLTNGAFFYSITRKLKKAEVADKEMEVMKKQDDEWQELYKEVKSQVVDLQQQVLTLRQQNEALSKQNGLLELKNQQLNWYRCTVNNCSNRKPPHVFDIDGIELEAQQQ